jgi:hypothetical protein
MLFLAWPPEEISMNSNVRRTSSKPFARRESRFYAFSFIRPPKEAAINRHVRRTSSKTMTHPVTGMQAITFCIQRGNGEITKRFSMGLHLVDSSF